MQKRDGEASAIARLAGELNAAQQAVHEPGSGAISNLECRLADLQERLLSTQARSLEDIVVRLEIARNLVGSLGPRGYLFDLIEACITDLRALISPDAATPRRPEQD